MSDELSSDKSSVAAGTDVRNLTPIGWLFGTLAIGIVVGGAIAMYQLQPIPRYLGIHIYGTGPALLCALPLIGLAVGFFKGGQLLCTFAGIPFYRDSVRTRVETAAGPPFEAAAGDYPCSVGEYEHRLRQLNRLEKFGKATMFVWGFPAMFGCIIAYDKLVGARSNGLTDILHLAFGGLIAFGPVAYVNYLISRPQTVNRLKLICPNCSHVLIGESVPHVTQSRCCPVCGRGLLKQ